MRVKIKLLNRISGITLPSPFCKRFCFSEDPNQLYLHHCPVPQKGRFAVVTNAGRDAVDAKAVR
jgi:hypothetical protein